jgi:hypothetical protein
MRIQFASINRAKAIAKSIALVTQLPLSACQTAFAQAAGYRDWFELNQFTRKHDSITLHTLDPSSGAIELTNLCLNLEAKLAADGGDILYALSPFDLYGRSHTLPEIIDIRCKMLRATSIPFNGRRKAGEVGRLKVSGRNAWPVLLREFGKPTRVVTAKSLRGVVADFEYVSPREPLPLFVPPRLFWAYGVWTEKDGSRVLFSRDYMPLWRLSPGSRPQRLEPWLWIEKTQETHFWDDRQSPWSDSKRSEIELRRLGDFGVFGLPRLVEALPLVFQEPSISGIPEAVEAMKAKALAGLDA